MKELIHHLTSDEVAGWCDVEKGNVLYDLVHTYDASTVVEIGTFGGRATSVFALALKSLGRGIVFGIDPWEKQACLEGVNDVANDEYWSNMDWKSLVKGYFDIFQKYDLLQYHAHLRKKDEDCLKYFADGSIDILHIDSNHSEELACQTVHLWWPKVKLGGIVVMDDINWFGPLQAVGVMKEYGVETLGEYDNSKCCFGVYQKI